MTVPFLDSDALKILALGVQAVSSCACGQAGHDVGNARTLAHYNLQHQMATRPLYLLTRWLTDVYTHESVPGKLLRETLLRVAQNWSPIKKAIARSLTGHGHLHQRGRLF